MAHAQAIRAPPRSTQSAVRSPPSQPAITARSTAARRRLPQSLPAEEASSRRQQAQRRSERCRNQHSQPTHSPQPQRRRHSYAQESNGVAAMLKKVRNKGPSPLINATERTLPVPLYDEALLHTSRRA